MDEVFLDIIACFVQERSRLHFIEHKRAILKQRLEERMRRLNLPDLASYWRYLREIPQEEPILLDILTINETSFFRNPNQFRFLTERIIPELEAEKGGEVVRSWGKDEPPSSRSIMKLRILCAGCSTGEEPYSVAMALADTLRYPRVWDIEILAGDLSENCIMTAAAGYYEADKLKGLPEAYAERYLERCGNGATVKEEIKRLIRFCRLNLTDIMNGDPLPGERIERQRFDIIFCRNVMIYFSPEAQQQLVDTLFTLLAPGGYLFTGDAEPLHLYRHDFEAVHEAGCLIYKKAETVPNAEAV
jgi:chemotaxis protein methyltransferase CheR